MRRPGRMSVRRHGGRGGAILGWVMLVALAGGCAEIEFPTTAPGPGVPRISNARIEPSDVGRGEPAILRFDFQDPEGDIMDVYIDLKREISDFTLSTGLGPTLISRGRYLGRTEGTAEETIMVAFERRFAPLTSEERGYAGEVVEPATTEEDIGIRVYTVFVVDLREQVSNRLEVRVTVR